MMIVGRWTRVLSASASSIRTASSIQHSTLEKAVVESSNTTSKFIPQKIVVDVDDNNDQSSSSLNKTSRTATANFDEFLKLLGVKEDFSIPKKEHFSK